ncbi:O-antigen ligase domain-containing protein [Alkalinema sp. FACHB-956]|uniref:O-antigen ligase domain-containing protein n=1 Tax=Alkalinema sp. FACHB-956 TaxID=2692768 RepID=UPI0016873332|nr:O-antigen ligase domain-containing protein [Alkalinema sp. FACHB-956]MBD2329064.1 O-antigen ligase domain-containing protein [Alkalinema sp. FACHB-956]
MFILIPIVLFGWLGIVFFLFKHLPPHRALIISFVTAYLFLPVYSYPIPGLPAYGKMSATCYAVLFSAIFLDWYYVKLFRPSLIDLPMLVWCTCPFMSSMMNGLGAYDGFRAASEQIAYWGVPYFFGRLYLGNLAGLKALAIGMLAGGVVYAPLCLFEFRMSPQLHTMLYGVPVNDYAFMQSIRKGGYRPILFNVHGLSVALWMALVTIIGIWLWQSGTLTRLWRISIHHLIGGLTAVVIIIQSTGAWLYLLLSFAILITIRFLRTTLLVLVLVATIASYLYVATTGAFNGDQLVQLVSSTINPERAQSLEFRFDNEKNLITKARQRMLFGWAGWGRSRVYNEYGLDVSVTDSFWVMTFGTTGVFGLTAVTTVILLPVVLLTYYYPAKTWLHPKIAPAAAIAIVLVFYMMDNLVNSMGNSVYVLAIGSLSGLIAQELRSEQLGLTGINLQVSEEFLQNQRTLQQALIAPEHTPSKPNRYLSS